MSESVWVLSGRRVTFQIFLRSICVSLVTRFMISKPVNLYSHQESWNSFWKAPRRSAQPTLRPTLSGLGVKFNVKDGGLQPQQGHGHAHRHRDGAAL